MKYQQSGISALLRICTLFSVLIFASFSANAVEIRGTVSAVDAGNLVRIKLPAGAVVAIGDEVRIETTLPNIGIIAIKTRWRVVKITAGFATANPLGKPTGRPQAGYAAVINTAALQAAITSPAKSPTSHSGGAPVTECDRLAAHSQDKDAVSRGVEFKNLDAGAVIKACLAAVRARPDISRFQSQLGRGLIKAGRRAEALRVFRKAAEMGSAQSMAFIGLMYMKGWEVPRDMTKSLHWFEKAAEKGNAGAMIFAASLTLHGQGIQQNPARAAKWYRMAAKEGIPEAVYNLAILHDAGRGVARDPARAARFLLQAFSGNSKHARHMLLETPERLSVATRKAIQRRLAQEGRYKGPVDGNFGIGTKIAIDTLAMRGN